MGGDFFWWSLGVPTPRPPVVGVGEAFASAKASPIGDEGMTLPPQTPLRMVG
jgi:hypothetical protein